MDAQEHTESIEDHGRVRTYILWIRSPTPYPLSHMTFKCAIYGLHFLKLRRTIKPNRRNKEITRCIDECISLFHSFYKYLLNLLS